MRGRRNTILSTSSTGLSCSPCPDVANAEKGNSSSSSASSRSPSPSPVRLRSDGVSAEYRRRRLLWTTRLMFLIFGSLVLIRCLRQFLSDTPARLDLSSPSSEAWTSIEALPSEPAIVALPSARWTISIPKDLAFPLSAAAYKDICQKASEMGSAAAKASHPSWAMWSHWRKQGNHDPAFGYVDIASAEKAGFLPVEPDSDSSSSCESSLTFVLGEDDISFGNSLLRLWLGYGIAQKEGRAFFLDASRWAWGDYSSYFIPPPTPNCEAPPTHHIVPFPHTAKHLVISSATLPSVFGDGSKHEYTRYKHGPTKQRRIYNLLRRGYEDLFQLNLDDATYATSRIAALQAESHTPSSIIGMHIRRGDLHPLEFQYNRDYLPLERYAEAAQSLLSSHNHRKAQLEQTSSLILASSDDPDITSSSELAHLNIFPAQDRIVLATKSTLDRASALASQGSSRSSSSPYRKHVDENAGWEGGFYAAMFGSVASEVKTLVGRAYAIDLYVLAHAAGEQGGGGIVCAVSAAGCRILGVATGWERMRKGYWINVDDGREWSWDGLGQ